MSRAASDGTGTVCARPASIAEEEAHSEHRAALEATLFHPIAAPLVFELDGGRLRLVRGPKQRSASLVRVDERVEAQDGAER